MVAERSEDRRSAPQATACTGTTRAAPQLHRLQLHIGSGVLRRLTVVRTGSTPLFNPELTNEGSGLGGRDNFRAVFQPFSA